jgi:hypothetical protein
MLGKKSGRGRFVRTKEAFMFITPFLVALFLAFILTLLLAVGFRGQPWGGGVVFFFLILFLATWAGGLWLTPVGPLMLGVPWMSFLLVALIVGLILLSMTPDGRRREEPLASKKAAAPAKIAIALDFFFWLLIGGLLIAIMAHYVVAV